MPWKSRLEDSAEAARFIEVAPISEPERELICRHNAARLLRLPGEAAGPVSRVER
jgi:predicted TIM-barrel fold metal-dependent hydrolase